MHRNLAKLSLRARLFLVFGTLVVLLVLAQAWLMRTLTQDLGEELDQVAFSVGTSVASVFTVGECTDDEPCDEMPLVFDSREKLSAGVQLLEPKGSLEIRGHAIEAIVSRHHNAARSASRGGAAAAEDSPSEHGDHGTEHSGATTWIWSSDGGPGSHDVPADLVQKLEIHSPESLVHPDEHEPGPSHGDHSVSLHVTGDLDSRVLMIQLPETTAAVPIPRVGLREKIERFQNRLWIGSGLLLLFGLAAAGMTAHRVAAPLARLADAAEQVGEGDLGLQVSAQGGGPEVGRTVHAFNAMSSRLASLREKNKQLEALRQLEEIGDVARGLAHSLRNPLNALGLSVEQLAVAEIEAPSPRSEQLAASARRQIQRLDAGIRSFLLLASPGDGTQAEPVAMDELIRDVVLEALQDAAGKVGVELELEQAAEPRLLAVAAELRAVTQALVVNAIEASPKGGRVTVRLLDSPSNTEGELCLEVDDRGTGVPESIRERLFTPHLSSKPTGSGMGLFLAHRIASHRYGGTLELLDRDGGGTRARLVVGPRKATDSDP